MVDQAALTQGYALMSDTELKHPAKSRPEHVVACGARPPFLIPTWTEPPPALKWRGRLVCLLLITINNNDSDAGDDEHNESKEKAEKLLPLPLLLVWRLFVEITVIGAVHHSTRLITHITHHDRHRQSAAPNRSVWLLYTKRQKVTINPSTPTKELKLS